MRNETTSYVSAIRGNSMKTPLYFWVGESAWADDYSDRVCVPSVPSFLHQLCVAELTCVPCVSGVFPVLV